MYFFKKKGKQYLDLTGNLILSHNDDLVKTRLKSAAPHKIFNATFIVLGNKKLKSTITVLRFIWGKPKPLAVNVTNLQKPVCKLEKPGQDDTFKDFENKIAKSTGIPPEILKKDPDEL